MATMSNVRRFIPAVLLAFAPAALWAQKAQITGRVTDATGAVVLDTLVNTTNVETGIRWEARTGEDGYYTLPLLPPGRYQMLVQKQGFKPISRSGIVLEVNQVARIDFVLEVGGVTDTVTVSGELPRIQTEDSSLGTVVERQRVEQLPLNGRNVFNMVKLVAGVQPRFNDTSGFAQQDQQRFSQMRINGGPVYGNQVLLDGAVNTAPVHNEISVVPMVDAVEEFRIETNALKAEYGQTSGGVINVASKSGTNELHGSLYEFFRNDALDARNAFATQVDPQIGRFKPVVRFNQYGGTAGGPVLIPRVYNGRNRTFLFGGYERWNHRSSGAGYGTAAALQYGTVPTAAERRGDFSVTRDAQGLVIPLFDPASTRPNPSGGGFVRTPLAGNLVPANRFDPVSARILEYIPLPNVAPNNPFTQTNNFLSLAVTPTDQGVFNIRIDHRFSERDSLFSRYSTTKNTKKIRGFGLGVADPVTNSGFIALDQHNWTLGETHVFSPTVINEFKGAVLRTFLPFQHDSVGGDWPEKLGMPQIIPRLLFPRVEIQGMLPIGACSFCFGVRASHYVQLSDNLTIVRGKHQIKLGTDQRWMRLNWGVHQFESGQYQFAPSLTGDPLRPAGTGFGMATFLLGEVTSGQLQIPPFYSFQSWTNGSFVQDDWKVTPRLTLNLGLRYDLASSPTERWDRHSNFDPFLTNPETRLPGVLQYSGVDAARHFVDRDYNNFGPRFGFAFDPSGTGRSVIRGGYGVVYMFPSSGDTQADASNSLGFRGVTQFVPRSLGPFAAFRLSQGPDGLVAPVGAAGGPSAARGQNAQYQDRNAPNPYLQQWNLTVQQALPAGWTVAASYAGNRGVKLFGGNYNLNQLDPANFSRGLALQNLAPNPFAGQIAIGALSGATVALSQLLLPYPDYLNVTTFANHGSASSYHSMQLTLERRYNNGLSAVISYTSSKLINDSFSTAGSSATPGEYRIGRLNRRQDRAIDEDDVSQRMVLGVVYELPFGPGKPWLSGARGAAGHLVGGWQVNSITTAQTGTPLLVRGANNFTGINWPDVVRDPTLSGAGRDLLRWFDTDAFRNPADFTIGNVPRTLPNTRGPGLFDISFSAFKKFQLHERAKLEFRAEMFNAINHVNPDKPNTTFLPNRQGANTNANFGRILFSQEARTIQLGLRLTF